MTVHQPQRQEVFLDEDGELREPMSVPDAQRVFCTQCGSANRAESQFCRLCGDSLDQQMAGLNSDFRDLPRRKSKLRPEYAQPTTKQPSALSVLVGAIVEIFTLLAVMVMVGVLAGEHQSGFIFLVLAAWCAVEWSRHRPR